MKRRSTWATPVSEQFQLATGVLWALLLTPQARLGDAMGEPFVGHLDRRAVALGRHTRAAAPSRPPRLGGRCALEVDAPPWPQCSA